MIKVRTVKPKLAGSGAACYTGQTPHLQNRASLCALDKKDSILGERYSGFNRASHCGVEKVDRIYSSLSTTLYISLKNSQPLLRRYLSNSFLFIKQFVLLGNHCLLILMHHSD
jgi:hypothetical protein